MGLSAIVQAMADAGCTPQQIAAAVAAHDALARAEKERALEKKRADAAERQRKFRARRNESNALHTVTSVTENDKKERSPTPPKEKTTSLTNVRENSNAREADFARVREAYPRRVGGDPRKSAAKAFDAAMKRGADLEAMVAGARAFAAFRSSDDPKFTPMLATWLNRDGWLEDYSAPPPRAGPTPKRSILSRIATGEFFDEPSSNNPDQPSASAPVSSGRGFAGEVPERARADGGGAVVDLRPTGSGWR
jgi:hypothetical protein